MKKLPSYYRSIAIRYLKKNTFTSNIHSIEEGKKLKKLYYTAMHYRAYDVYTTALYALSLSNEDSLLALQRMQLENFLQTEYIKEHPEEIVNVFDKSKTPVDYKRTLKWFKKHNRSDGNEFGKLHEILSQHTHSLPEGMKSCFNNIRILNPSTMEFDAALSVSSHHGRIPLELAKEHLLRIIVFYVGTIDNLSTIENSDFEGEIEDFSHLHRYKARNDIKKVMTREERRNVYYQALRQYRQK